MPALSSSEPSPKVTIVSGNAMRIKSGHSSALMIAIAPATSRAASKESDSRPGSSAVMATRASASTPSMIAALHTEPDRLAPTAQVSLGRCAHRWLASRCYLLVMVDGAVAAGRVGGAADRIAFLGHATVLIELEGVRLLTDPLLRSRVAHLRRQPPPVASEPVRRT